ncbi:hypothetical protein DVG78_24880 [Runella aurantiaca]|uniref:Uncharacterized protein n=1 Tax=Runella aurantiaca TaxID=2282308 RepID=A0A369I3S4_9BACT|nr:hypothetical protein DVG78_24880 [Runella aurantiaca]
MVLPRIDDTKVVDGPKTIRLVHVSSWIKTIVSVYKRITPPVRKRGCINVAFPTVEAEGSCVKPSPIYRVRVVSQNRSEVAHNLVFWLTFSFTSPIQNLEAPAINFKTATLPFEEHKYRLQSFANG